MQTQDKVYHFTNTPRLPWILKSRQLMPGRNQIGGFPSPDFLWATTDARGDRTASSNTTMQVDAWRSGLVRLVRFTLAVEDFETWPGILPKFPQWTSEHVARLENCARACGVSPSTWYCRTAPLALERWLTVETRTYTGPWQTFEYRNLNLPAGDDVALVLGDQVYLSLQIVRPGQPTQYSFQCVSRADFEFARKFAEIEA